jgi:PAS domain-containing protein
MPEIELSEDAEDISDEPALMRATLQALPDGILVTDEQGRITTLNANLGEMWRKSQQLIKSGDIHKFQMLIAEQLKNPERHMARTVEIEASNRASFDLLELRDGRCIEQYSEVISI